MYEGGRVWKRSLVEKKEIRRENRKENKGGKKRRG